MKRRVICLLLVLILLVGAFPFMASAASTAKPTISSIKNGGVDSGITIKWTDDSGATKYRVQRKTDSDSTWTNLTSSVTTKSYTDKTATVGGETYYYRVRGYVNGAWGTAGDAKSIVRNPFTDVSSSASYFKALMWAVNSGVVAGTSNTEFSPNTNCTRGQFALMLWRMNGKPSISGMSNPFTDVKSTNGFYKGIVWCYNKSITAGTSETTFSPNNNITRWQMILMLWRMLGKPASSITKNPFTDVKTTASYYKAALWAYEKGITGVKTFKPNDLCTRWQLVLFLYRIYNKYYAAASGFPDEVTIYIPQNRDTMLDRSGRIMVEYWEKKYPDVKFTVKNTNGGNGGDLVETVADSQSADDLSVILFHGPGAIVNYYYGYWDYNLANQKLFKAACANIGQEQPSGGVTLIKADETRFDSIPTLIQYIKAHPGEIRISYTTGTAHEIRIKLILNYFGITKDDVNFQPGSMADIRAWIQGGSTDVAIITETAAAADIKGGKVKGICNSVPTRDLYTEDLAPLTNVPILPEIEGIKLEDVDGLVCAWPMTMYVPASVSDEKCQWLNDLCATILNDSEFMTRIKQLGSTNTFQIFSLKEINDIQQMADRQIKTILEKY